MVFQILDLNGINVGVVDERGEISAMYKGKVENDLGIRTDVLNNIKKDYGIEMLVRSMSPKVIVCDEIGNKRDIYAVNYALTSGTKGIFTSHGSDFKSLKLHPFLSIMLKQNLFEKIIFLSEKNKGTIKEIYSNID